MVRPSRHSRSEGMTTSKWLSWTLFALCASSASAATRDGPVIASGTDPPQPLSSRISQAGRSPAEIPLLHHEIPTAKFRNTNEEVGRYQALAPASYKPAVRAPTVQSVESQELSLPDGARRLTEWEADDIILLSTIDGALHARDRRTGRQRWTLDMSDPMIQAVHYNQNRSQADQDQLQIQDEYIFIIEPSADGRLYAQFADPSVGLVGLKASVRKMAAEGGLSMNVNGQRLATTSSQDFRSYTIDAQTGHVLHEFPKSRSSVKGDPQPRCRPRSGLDFEDSSCRPGPTLRLGRNTYTFTISSEDTGLDLCTIQFSEWVSNRGDQDLQHQHTTPLDEFDLRVFHDGAIMGLDTSAEHRPVRYKQWLESPVARIFDVARKVDEDDDSTEVAVLSRTAQFQASNAIQLLQEDPNFNQRVFINKTKGGQWYAMSEASYPGVTSRAMLANIERDDYLPDRLNLHGDMIDIVGVHRLAGKQAVVKQQARIAATPEPRAYTSPNSDLIVEPQKDITIELAEESVANWNRLSDGFWGAVVTLLVCALAYSWRHYSLKHRLKALPAIMQKSELFPKALEVEVASPVVPDDVAVSSSTPELVEAVTTMTSAQHRSAITPIHSRAQSTVSATGSPGKESGKEDDQSDDGESDNDEPQRKKKKTKRGVRGGRRNKKRTDAATFEPKPITVPEKQLKDGSIQVGKITYDGKLENCLGEGSSGTAVFPGTYEGRLVAVKRLIKTSNSLAEKEIRHLVSSDEHENVIRYYGKEESTHFFYIALDKFDTSLDQFVEFYDKFPTLVSPTKGYDVKDALRQITLGVQHLHSLKLVHRDIKPQNILVRPKLSKRALPEGQLTPLKFVISDFGLCKPLEDGPESVFAATRTAAGTTGWKAPELLVSSRDAIAAPPASVESVHSTASESPNDRSRAASEHGTVIDPPSGRRATKAIDIFSLGCVFFYVLTRGGHPFDCGSPLARDHHIKNDNHDTSLLRDSFTGYDYEADDMIMTMIMHNPKHRPDTAGVLGHPYFWRAEQKLDFLCAVSDKYEQRKQQVTNIHDENAVRTSAEKATLVELAALQDKAVDVIGLSKQGNLQSFLDALPKSFLTEMGKQRKYTGTKMIDLLRVIRNKNNHFDDLPVDVKNMMLKAGNRGGLPNSNAQIEGYYAFWRDRFPSLLVNCHQLLVDRGLVDEFGLGRYYDGTLS